MVTFLSAQHKINILVQRLQFHLHVLNHNEFLNFLSKFLLLDLFSLLFQQPILLLFLCLFPCHFFFFYSPPLFFFLFLMFFFQSPLLLFFPLFHLFFLLPLFPSLFCYYGCFQDDRNCFHLMALLFHQTVCNFPLALFTHWVMPFYWCYLWSVLFMRSNL